MLPAGLDALLILQDRDARRSQLEKILAQAPRERVAVDARIVAHRAAIDAAKKGVAELEVKRKELETTIRGFEDQAVKYKNQQMLVKKNDEYQALSHEIAETQRKAGEVEEAEIKILYDLDTERERAKAAEKQHLAEIAAENAQLARLGEREAQARNDVAAAVAEVEKARAVVNPSLLPRYDRLAKSVGLPAVVSLHDQKCGGCHLKVSNGVLTDVRKGVDVVSCDNCGRILYFEL